jgi:hypothetical protein
MNENKPITSLLQAFLDRLTGSHGQAVEDVIPKHPDHVSREDEPETAGED